MNFFCRLVICATITTLSGCTNVPLITSSEEVLNRASSACWDSYRIERTIKTAGEYVDCRRQAIMAYTRAASVPADTVAAYLQKMETTATKKDRGQITIEAADQAYIEAGRAFNKYVESRQRIHDDKTRAYVNALNMGLASSSANSSRETTDIHQVVVAPAVAASPPSTDTTAPCQKQLLGTITNPCNAE